jgi:hypothetical protein
MPCKKALDIQDLIASRTAGPGYLGQAFGTKLIEQDYENMTARTGHLH